MHTEHRPEKSAAGARSRRPHHEPAFGADPDARGARPADYPVGITASPRQMAALDRALLQFRSAVGGPRDADAIAHARQATAGPGGALPYQDRIQRAFGHHDIRGIGTHTGAAAQASAREMGARAFAFGDQVVLGADGGDLHTVAHEAAHVVQQRAGVSLAGGVGRAGDRYEQHADAVADAVVAGRSAEALLDQMAPAGASAASAPAVQRYTGTLSTEDGAPSQEKVSQKVLPKGLGKKVFINLYPTFGVGTDAGVGLFMTLEAAVNVERSVTLSVEGGLDYEPIEVVPKLEVALNGGFEVTGLGAVKVFISGGATTRAPLRARAGRDGGWDAITLGPAPVKLKGFIGVQLGGDVLRYELGSVDMGTIDQLELYDKDRQGGFMPLGPLRDLSNFLCDVTGYLHEQTKKGIGYTAGLLGGFNPYEHRERIKAEIGEINKKAKAWARWYDEEWKPREGFYDPQVHNCFMNWHKAGNSHAECEMQMLFYLNGVDHFRRWWPKHVSATWQPLHGRSESPETLRQDQQSIFYAYRDIFPWSSSSADIEHFRNGVPSGNPPSMEAIRKRERTIVTEIHGGEYDEDA